jgi:membrane protein
MLKQTASDWSEDKAMKLSAALALYTILSMAPLLVITIKVLSLVFGSSVASKQVQQQMDMLIGPAGSQAVADMVGHATQPGSGVVAKVVSFVILLFSASAVFGELQDSLNTIWEVRQRPDVSWWVTIRKRLLSMGMVFVIAFLLLVSLFVSTALTTVTGRLIGSAGWVALVTDVVVSVVVVSVLIAMLFRVLPDVRLGWRDVMVGAVVTGVLFKVGQYVLGLYFRYGSSTSAYGAAGSFVAVLLWVYYSAWILFFGAEFTKAWVRAHGRWVVPDQDSVKVTDGERAQQGMVSQERLERKARQQQPGKDVSGPGRRSGAEPRSSEWEVKEREWD